MSNGDGQTPPAETALTIASAVASALPPPWDLAGPALSVIGGLLPLFFPTATPADSSLSQILQAMNQQSANQDIQSSLNAITTEALNFNSMTQGSSSVPLPTNLEAALTTPGPFLTLYTFLQEAVTGVDDEYQLMVNINAMSTTTGGDVCPLFGNLQAAFLPAFAVGVSTYIMLATYWVSLVASVDQAAVSAEINVQQPINWLSSEDVQGQSGWIGYAQWIVPAFSALVNERLAQVGPATPCDFKVPQEVPAGLPVSGDADYIPPMTIEYGVYFQDFGGVVDGFDPSVVTIPDDPDAVAPFPGNLPFAQTNASSVVYAMFNPSNSQETVDYVGVLRDNYVDALRQQLYANYFDPDLMNQTILGWTTSLKRLQNIPTSG